MTKQNDVQANWRLPTAAEFKKIIAWIIKLALLIVSTPATASVTRFAFPGLPVLLLYLVIFAAVCLVEGAFLYFWVQIESKTFKQNSSIEEYRLYVIGAWAMFILLLAIGLLHGEGFAAIPIRGSAGLILLVSTHDTLQHFAKREDESIAKGDKLSRKVQNAQRKAKDEIALAKNKAEKNAYLKAIQDCKSVLDEGAKQILLEEYTEKNLLPSKAKQSKTTDANAHAKIGMTVDSTAKPTAIANANSKDIASANTYFSLEELADGEFKVFCSWDGCNYAEIANNKLSATRKGAAHSKKHKNGHAKFADLVDDDTEVVNVVAIANKN